MKNFFKNKKGYKYQKVEENNNSKREVISYEDVPLDEVNEEDIKFSKESVKKILILVAVLFVLGLIVFAVANRDNLTPDKIQRWIKYDVLGSTDTGFPVDLIGTTVNEANFVVDDEVYYVSDTSYVALSYTGNEICYDQMGYQSPVLKVSGDNLLIYSLGGKGFSTGTIKEVSNEFDTDYDIYTADINSKGYYCVVTKADGYLCKLTAYNNDDEKLYSYSFSEYYITNVALNADGSGCVVSGLSAENGSLSAIAYVLNFKEETPQATYSLDDNVIYDIDYLDSNSVCIIGSNASFVLNVRKQELKEINYDKMQLTAYDINENTGKFVVSLSRTGDGRQCSIQYINDKGEVVSVNDTDRSIESISLYKNRVVVLDSNTAYLYNIDSEYLGSADAGNGSKVVRLDSSSSAYVLGINEIRKIIEFTE